MARHARVVVPDLAIHIVQRGNNRSDCFNAESDRLVYLAILREQASIRRCAVHAYCLMTNHVHLLLTPSEDEGPSLMMRELARCYSSYFNRRYQRTGTLWEGRFRSCLVDSAAYVLGCYRYIELNPVRAGMVTSAELYKWSSHRANTRRTVEPSVSGHPEFLALTPDAYSGLFSRGDDPEFLKTMRTATFGGYPLVGDQMKARLAALGIRTEPGKPGPRSEERGSRGRVAREPDAEITYLTPN